MKSKRIEINPVGKQILVDVDITPDHKTLRYSIEVIGNVVLYGKKSDGTKVVLKQWELELSGETLKVKVVK